MVFETRKIAAMRSVSPIAALAPIKIFTRRSRISSSVFLQGETGLSSESMDKRKRKQSDIIITTALIPGRPAPILISEDTVKAMKAGSVIVDMAVEQGGNCPLSELGKTVIKHGVTIIGEPNLPALCGADASALYSRNVLDFLKLIINKDSALAIDRSDEIVAATLMCTAGEVLRK